MTEQRELDLGARDIALDTVARVDANAQTPTTPATCSCLERGWVCRHEPSYEERLEAIFAPDRTPGEEG